MRKDRLLLIGQAPGRSGDNSRPLEGRIGRRLASLVGVPFERYLEATERMNLFDVWPGKNGKGDAWDVKKAKTRANKVRPLLRGRRVLFLGRNVVTAFGFSWLSWLTWCRIEETEVAVIPHPSGIVLWWNDERNRAAAGVFLRSSMGSP